MYTNSIIDEDYIREVTESYFIEEMEYECGIHPSQILDDVRKILKSIFGITITDEDSLYMDYKSDDRKVDVVINDKTHGTYDYLEGTYICKDY